MKIGLIAEGKTERAFLPHLRRFLQMRVPAGNMPRLSSHVCDGRIPTGDKLRRVVERLLRDHDAVIALTDVYTGGADFQNALAARKKMSEWVGEEHRFYPHAAQHDFEAWLLPYWTEIQRLSGSNRAAPAGDPEMVNHQKPPAHRIAEVFRTGSAGRAYVKTRDANRILEGNDLTVAAVKCPELKALLNTILTLCGGNLIP